MSHFAKVENGIVTHVIVAEQDFINSGLVGDPSIWIQTSYNTYAGEHRLGGTPLRKNYAGLGYTYDSERDAFIPPNPFPSWILNENTCLWNPPIPMPTSESNNVYYTWNEETQNWTENTTPELPTDTPLE
ncbi:hypothetical protein UFOVP1636_217 [uncultured Caudovirales phage]|uniref:Uncharacterized protein n=1 Tax=uncultured Caudovirales phage TaxID=2100421 RepID=A0A6J5T2R0_9CAUD|nr:hypothetical protein UFOVP1636_217 [uncultured Caudovirales phage]